MASRTRLSPLLPQGTAHYIYDTDGHLIAEAFGATAASAVIVRKYIWLEDMPVAVVDGVNTASPVITYVHTDHLARPIRMTDGAKATVWQATWTPWGTAFSMTGSVLQDLRFPGQYFLMEQGLAYNWHRFYDPTLGRYTQPDPLGFVDGPSVYAYAGSSPFMRTDRSGLDAICLPGSNRPGCWPPRGPLDGGGGGARGGGASGIGAEEIFDYLWRNTWRGLVQMCREAFGGGGGGDDENEEKRCRRVADECLRHCTLALDNFALPDKQTMNHARCVAQ